MSDAIPYGYDPARGGCQFILDNGKRCGSQDTVTLTGTHGRRCAAHPPWKSLAAEGKFPEAWRCLRSWLAVREHDAGGAA